MNKPIQSNKYDSLVKKIKTKEKAVLVFTFIVLFGVFILCFPIHISFMDKSIIDHDGIGIGLALAIALFIIICETVALGIVALPLNTSLTAECDPEKYIVLNSKLNKQKNLDNVYSVGYIYLGDFESALEYANKMVRSDKPYTNLTGLFDKARCEFFLHKYDSLKNTVSQHQRYLADIKNKNLKTKAAYDKIQQTMNLLVAISCNDKEKITEYCNIDAWNDNKTTHGYINYLKGLAAYNTDDKKEAIYRFMLVKDNCGKTVFAQYAEDILSELNNDI